MFWAAPANATALEQAQAALALGQQEVIDAQIALASASLAVQAASESLAIAQADYDNPSNSTIIPATTQTITQNVVRNGTFDSTDFWSGVVASNTVYNGGAWPIIFNGTLKGSYSSGYFVLQEGTFPAPTRQVQFSVDVWNYDTNDGSRINNPDYYRIEFRTYASDGTRLNYYNFQWSQWHEWISRGASYTLDRDAVRWDIGFRMADGGFWAGNFGPTIDNVVLNAVMTTGTPEQVVVDPAVIQARITAVQAYDAAVIALNAAQIRYNTALAAIPGLEQGVVDATPYLNSPTNLTASLTEAGVQLDWSAPAPHSSGVSLERYAIMWSTTNWTSNGWGWVHDQTSVTIPFDILRDYGGLGSEFQFRIRADNDSQSVYSDYSNVATIVVPIPEPQATPPTIPQGALVFSENQVAELVAPQYHRISFIAGYYGDPNDSRNGLDVSSVLTQYIGSQSATIPATNEMFTDTAPGTPKILILLVNYEFDPELQAAQEEALRLAAEEAARIEAERLAAEAAAEAARLEAIRLENERLAAEQAARVAAEQAAAAAAEAARLEAERVERERIAALEAAERLRQEQLAAEAERARLAAEEAARLAAEEAARLAVEEAARIAAEEAARLEAERLAKLEAERLAKLEAERLEAERLEKERLAAEEAARLEAERLAKLEAERLEAERLAKLEAERLAAEEKARQEAEANKPKPSPEPTTTPTPEPTQTPSPEPKPKPTTPTPTPTPSKPTEPIVPENKPTVEIKEEITAENIAAVVAELATIQPQQLTSEQQTLIVEAALETFKTAEQGSEEYEAALDALLVVAQADDIVLDEELAAIPLVGNVAGAAVEVFNALGNAGADMSPQVREQSEKVVIAAVIVGQVAMTATAAATSAAAAAARRP